MQVIPSACEEQLLLVELVRSVSAMRTETVIQTVKEVLKQPPAIAKEKVAWPSCTALNALTTTLFSCPFTLYVSSLI